jgi:hypothetical protein
VVVTAIAVVAVVVAENAASNCVNSEKPRSMSGAFFIVMPVRIS